MQRVMFSPERLTELNEAITRTFGLRFDAKRLSELERRLGDAAQAMDLTDIEGLARQVTAGTCTAAQLAMLARHLTTGETHFLRDLPLMHGLQSVILPGLIARRRASGVLSLRIWCAACSTGEELYTLAIILRDLLPDIAAWQIALIGSDVNSAAVSAARNGEYRDWSFRGTPKSFQEQWFVPTREGTWRVRPELHAMARFEVLNLMRPDYATALGERGEFDLIVCRNVFIYFPAEVIQTIARQFAGLLGTTGWLCVAPTEAAHENFPGYARQLVGGAIFFRPADAMEETPPPRTPLRIIRRPLRRAAAAQAPAGALTPPGRPRVEALIAQVAQPAPGAEGALQVRALADAGRGEEALRLCEALVTEHPFDVRAHRLLAMLLAETGETARAADVLRTLLFLDPGDAVAHFMLGHAQRQLGKPVHARRRFVAALRLAAAYPPETALDEDQDLTAGMLCEYLRQELQP